MPSISRDFNGSFLVCRASALLYTRIKLNSFKANDTHGPYWICGICGEHSDIRIEAEKCCSRMVEYSDPNHGRQKLKAYVEEHEQRWAKPHPRPYQELIVAQRSVSY